MKTEKPEMIKPRRTRKPPARRDYAPGRTSPGQEITWERTAPGGLYGELRTGVIWSDGPEPRMLWVRPDDGGPVTAVLVPTPKQAAAGVFPSEMRALASHAREAMRRAEAVRKLGRPYVVVDQEPEEPARASGYRKIRERILWHAGPCPAAEGRRRASHRWLDGVTVWDVIDAITGRSRYGALVDQADLCPRCIMTPEPESEPAGERELATVWPARTAARQDHHLPGCRYSG